MGLVNQNDPAMVTTTMGLRKRKPPLCWTCRERRPDEIYGIDVNGNPICETCRSPKKAENG